MSKMRRLIDFGKSLSIQMKFTFTVTAITVVILLVNILLFSNIDVMLNKLNDIYDSNLKLNELSAAFDAVQDSMKDYLDTKSTDSMEQYYRYEQDLQEKLDTLNANPTGDKILLAEKNIKNMGEAYLELTDGAIEAKRGRNVEKYRVYYDEASSLHEYLSTYIYSLNNEQFKVNAASYQVLSKSLNYMVFMCLVIFALIAIIGIVLVSIISNTISTPLRELVSAANSVSEGNFDVELPRVTSTDEVGIVTKAFSSMVVSIQNYIEQLRDRMEKERELKEKELLMEAHLKDAKLKYLQAQINPHFLFNTLNAGAQLAMMEGADKAYEYIQQVATFFRYNIKKNNDVVTLREEISLVDTYIYILNVRFSGEIGYEKDIDEQILDIRVPSMIIQPIVENAVNYGIRNIDWKGKVTLSVHPEDNQVCVSVKDNGVGILPEKIAEIMNHEVKSDENHSDSNGVGLDNVMNRLQLFYGTDKVMDIFCEGKDLGTEVLLYLPFNKEELYV